MVKDSVFVYVVLYNSVSTHSLEAINSCIEALINQNGYKLSENLFINIRDNGSTDNSLELVRAKTNRSDLKYFRNESNLGFCGAYNQAAKEFLDSKAEYFLILNSDLRLAPDFLHKIVSAVRNRPEVGSACGLLYRADAELNQVSPAKIDSAGMYMTPSLRHFDRGSDENDSGQYSRSCFVFGSTGACMLLRREFIKSVALVGLKHEHDLERLYPALAKGRDERVLLFDEAFFAYREDAELAWRAQRLGWRCLFVPEAKGYHRRIVLPQHRSTLPAKLNYLGVRNRFLLQLNHLYLFPYWRCFIPGFVVRNLLVIVAVFLTEPKSLPAFLDLLKLLFRALERRRILAASAKVSACQVARWFRADVYTEPLE